MNPSLSLGVYKASVEERLEAWQRANFARRLWRKDPTLWSATPLPELTDRLGWLTLPETPPEALDALATFAEEVRAEGVRFVVLLGMGGSSLAPEVFQATFGNRSGFPELIVLDSTHPAAVQAVLSRIALPRTLFLVSSKSGTTLETLSFFRFFWHKVKQMTGLPGRHFVAITDPGTPLMHLAEERGFRRCFESPPEVGGRYSALSVFGLLPAALVGVDIHRVLDRARTMAEACASSVPVPENPGLVLGATLGELALAGRDKVTFLASPSLQAFPTWLEQLIAESTGKDGKGIVPVVDEPPASPEVYGDDRFFIHLSLQGDDQSDLERRLKGLEDAGHPVARVPLAGKADLGQEFFRWEVAVAAAGAVLDLHPFNQPDVELAKTLAQKAMVEGGRGTDEPGEGVISAREPEALALALRAWLAKARPGDYVALQAYLAPTEETTVILQKIRLVLRDRLRLATTLDYGPRFLHSTGQLHKGGPNTGLFLQLLDEPVEDLPVPETGYTFGTLLQAQALGDYQALKQRGRRVLQVHLDRDVEGGLARLLAAVQG